MYNYDYNTNNDHITYTHQHRFTTNQRGSKFCDITITETRQSPAHKTAGDFFWLKITSTYDRYTNIKYA